jgi:hypothetical protein
MHKLKTELEYHARLTVLECLLRKISAVYYELALEVLAVGCKSLLISIKLSSGLSL